MWHGGKLESDKDHVRWDVVAVPRSSGLSQGSRSHGRDLSWVTRSWVCVGKVLLSVVWRVQWEVEKGEREGEEYYLSDLQDLL